MVNNKGFWILLSFLHACSGSMMWSAASSNLTCSTASHCLSLAKSLQVKGTQEGFVDSTVVLHNALSNNQWSDDYDYALWSSYGKLNLFYTLNWQIAKDAIDKSLSLDKSANNLNSFLYAGWLHSTMGYRDIDAAAAYFQSGIDLVASSDNPSNFWPYFEFAVFNSHIAEDFDESRRLFELAVNASSMDNPFIAFFYGLLVKYHLDDDDNVDLDGEQLIQSALQVAEAGQIPGEAAWNLVFQSLLLDSMNRLEEAKRCCEFSAAILNRNVSNWYLFCPNINDNQVGNDDGDYDYYAVQDSESAAVGKVNMMAWIGLTVIGNLLISWFTLVV